MLSDTSVSCPENLKEGNPNSSGSSSNPGKEFPSRPRKQENAPED
jgi:hypothetical protein